MANVLVVDDETAIAELTKDHLAAFNHQATIMTDSAQALAQLQKNLPDLILLDVSMPGMDGYTFCQKLQEDPRTQSVPVVMVTAKAKMRDTFAQFANVRGFLEKPYTQTALIAVVNQALQK